MKITGEQRSNEFMQFGNKVNKEVEREQGKQRSRKRTK